MNKTIIKSMSTLSVLSCLILSLTACTKSNGNLNNRVVALEDRINTMDIQIDGTQPAEVWSRMQTMENDLSIVRNQMNDLDNRMSGPKGSQTMSANERLDRMEAALREISTRLGIKVEAMEQPYIPPSQVQLQGTPTVSGTALLQTAPIQQANTQATNSDGTVTVLINGVPHRVPVSPNAPPQQVVTSSGQSAPLSGVTSQAPNPSTDVAQTLYNRGLDFFNKYQYADGLICFKDFTENYPNNALIGNAWFWQGECSYQLKDYPGAVVAYQKVISQYPKNNKYVSSLLKQGMSLAANGNHDQAKVRWNEIVNRFPNTPEATRAKQLLANKN